MISGKNQGALDALHMYLGSGGWVMPALVLITMALWYAIGSRWALLDRGPRNNVRVLITRELNGRSKNHKGIIGQAIQQGVAIANNRTEYVRDYLDDAFSPYYKDLKKYRVMVTALVAVAPLLGLLGTVMGMIETFRSLGDMSMFSSSGGIAGGIATALFTTQMGLIVAVPGVIVKSILDRREQQIADDLEQIKDILVSSPEFEEVKE